MQISRLKKETFKTIPTKPGIYFFYTKKQTLIYIGKATNLRSRVKSYFQGSKTPRPIEEMIDEVATIKWEETDSVLEAIIIEGINIKKHQPKYNVLGKDDKSWNYLVITKEEFPRLKTFRLHDMKQLTEAARKKSFLKLFGPFPNLRAKETMKILQRIFNVSTCKPNQNRPCIYYQMNQCLGVCTGEISAKDYKRKVINPLSLFLSGKKKKLIADLEKDMRLASNHNNYEEAARLRDQIANLKRIHDVTLIDDSFLKTLLPSDKKIRIEGYDISNLGASGLVGSLVVFENGMAQKHEYKKFRIRGVKGQSDVDSLAEVLERRLKHDDWPLPDYFLVDGGKPQVNRAKRVLTAFNLKLPIIGIAKGPTRKKNDFILNPDNKKLQSFVIENENTLIQTRDEAHRFAINYQRQTRRIKRI